MKNLSFLILLSIASLDSLILEPFVLAQVSPDQSLNTQVLKSNSLIRVNGGRQSSNNLFHSFKELNINSNQQVLFENGRSIVNIFARVTGGRVSVLDGLIATQNPANLYILNSNGIFFGNSIQLNIGGSFFSSTATSIQFDDGLEFYSENGNNSFLSPTQPEFVKFNGMSGEIALTGNGNQLNVDPVTSIGIGAGRSTSGIRVNPGQQVVVLGNGVSFDGGIITAPSGNINVGSVKEGVVGFQGFQQSKSGNTVDYALVKEFNDIRLSNSSLVDASSFPNNLSRSFISFEGKNLTLESGSFVVIQNEGSIGGGKIQFNFKEAIQHIGIKNRPSLPPGLTSLRNTSGIIGSSVFSQGPDISIKAKNLTLLNAGVILNNAAFAGKGGNIDVDISDSIRIEGDVLPDPIASFSTILTSSNGTATAGKVNIKAAQLSLNRHGTIQSISFSSSPSESVNILVSKKIILNGNSEFSGLPSSIFSSSFRSGRAADVNIKTSKLSIFDGGFLISTALASGDSGNLIVNANDSILLSGIRTNSDGGVDPSGIGTFANVSPTNELIRFGLPPFPSGNLGVTQITTNSLKIQEGAVISTSNEGFGRTGDLFINANNVQLSRGAIESFAIDDDGGNINLNTKVLLLDDLSRVAANSFGTGTGGNINVTSDLIILKESVIAANSAQSTGGNISIDTLGLFLSPDSTITATSQLGTQFDGSVDVEAEITDFNRDPNLNIQSEPPELYASCGPTYRDTLAYYRVGSAGQPINPETLPSSESRWMQVAKARYDQRRLTYADPETGEHKPLKRVVGWKANDNGTVTFVNDPREADQYASEIASTLQACQPDPTAKAG
ncbi:filamentous hemagglutinin N-terminal domain-containing protein [Acaryochloris marina]|uniref:two-partner secretion domain-containing protein n=1 Tax=Acaryochloris marina TaxID=155978 RepID=UPI001BB08C4D|nr:filamentous hemagglutinin N-terminal domain-containing protein [Acaryochloris marina]QUY45627.1 filamentous hemagglutinin N-terminal domain-containing protein [Acaryochloris marina S15]